MRTELEALLMIMRGEDQAAEKLIRSLSLAQQWDLNRALKRLDALNMRVASEILNGEAKW
jgi:hypothetical protein